MSKSTLPKRLKRCNRIADYIDRLSSHVEYMRAELRRIIPLREMDRLLRDTTFTPAEYTQRLIDMGMTLPEAIDHFQSVRNTDTDQHIEDLPANFVSAKPLVWQERLHWPTRSTTRTPSLSPRSHQLLTTDRPNV